MMVGEARWITPAVRSVPCTDWPLEGTWVNPWPHDVSVGSMYHHI